MKKTLIIGLSIICFVLKTNSQNNTTQDFNIPITTTLYITGKIKYNVETKQLTPIEQTQHEFKNGLLVKEYSAKIIGTLKIGSQKIYTYNAENELTNIEDSGGLVDGGASNSNYKITYTKTGNSVYIYRNSQAYAIKIYSVNGKLLEEDFYDYHSKYIFRKCIYKDGVKITETLNNQNIVTEKTTEYLNKNNEPLVKVLIVPKSSYHNTVTYFTYSTNGDLQATTTYIYNTDKLKPNFEYFKDGKATEVPKEALKLTPSATTFYNYSEGTTWVARASTIMFSNEIEVSVRAIQSSDGKLNNINNQATFMAFLDATYQKIKAKKA